jgi:alginate O-acetyltransferase complex protein AlgI
MLFNSPIYIFIFLPIVVLFYYFLNRYRLKTAAKSWLVLASLFFYGYWDYRYLMLIIGSVLVNYALGTAISSTAVQIKGDHHPPPGRKPTLVVGIIFNLGLLAYFKYADFFLENANLAIGTNVTMLNLVLPLAISFFTFQQVAYLVDSYQGETREYDFLNYCLFVTFFPQLIAGPIVHHKEMMPQFENPRNLLLQMNHVTQGVFLFSLGLFKKVFIADSFALWADQGFSSGQPLDFFTAWGTSLSYTFQLYYDFSGYSDMAIGAALLFNIRLPINFNSPYKALNIQDFWRRWHMTLSRFLRDYLYIPQGGNRKGSSRTYINLFITFLLGGLWHGAGWTFVLWGALHGAALMTHRLWTKIGLRMYPLLAWFLTFMFANVTWVFFRAESVSDAISILKGMLGMHGVVVSGQVESMWARLSFYDINHFGTTTMLMPINAGYYILIFAGIAFLMPNSLQISGYSLYSGIFAFKRGLIAATFVASALFYSLVAGIQNAPSAFLYFNF